MGRTRNAPRIRRTFRELVVIAGLGTLEEAAARLGVTSSYLSQINGGQRPGRKFRAKLCNALGVTESELLDAIAYERPKAEAAR